MQLTITLASELTVQNLRTKLRLDNSYESLSSLSKQSHTPITKSSSAVDMKVEGKKLPTDRSRQSLAKSPSMESEGPIENIVPSDEENDAEELSIISDTFETGFIM